MTRLTRGRTLALFGAALAAGGCGGGGQPQVAVGAKNFTEELILGEIYAQVLAGHGLRVARKLNLGGTDIAMEALRRGEIDLYPEYTGTALLTQLKLQPIADGKRIYTLVKAAYEKVPGSHWAMYEEMYGSPGGRYLVIRALKSASEVDKSFGDDMQWMAAMGMDGMKQLSDLVSNGIESVERNLFVINPRESYPPEEWVKSDPDFWMPKAAHKPMGEAKKPAEKPTGAQ